MVALYIDSQQSQRVDLCNTRADVPLANMVHNEAEHFHKVTRMKQMRHSQNARRFTSSVPLPMGNGRYTRGTPGVAAKATEFSRISFTYQVEMTVQFREKHKR
jgi:hypothetical protein